MAQAPTGHAQAGEVSRRSMLAGTVATTAVAAAGPIGSSAYAHSADPNSSEDMMAFLLLSAALTGIHVVNLAPEFSQGQDSTKPLPILKADPGVDPINVKNDYFNWINTSDARNVRKTAANCQGPSRVGARIISQRERKATIPNIWRAASCCCGISAPGTNRLDLKTFSAPGRPRTYPLAGRFSEGLHPGSGLANRASPSDGLQQPAVRLLVARAG